MHRCSNTENIHFNHLKWDEDSLCVYFAHMKNDQMGERKDPRHVYANPLQPQVSAILSLAIYFLVCSFDRGASSLFPGTKQYDRFEKALKRLCGKGAVAVELAKRGFTIHDIGTHSIRKGGFSHCMNGSTTCPPAAATHLRGGWKLEGVQDRYLRHEAAGDYYVGRTIAGLPIDDPRFGILPPHFLDPTDAEVRLAIQICYPDAPAGMEYILEMCVASLVYHANFLVDKLPKNHPVLLSALFMQGHSLLPSLKAKVACSVGQSTRMRSTGLNAEAIILRRIEQIETGLSEVNTTLRSLPDAMRTAIADELEKRAVESGTITRQFMAEQFQMTQQNGIDRVLILLEEIRKGGPAVATAPATSTTSAPVYTVHAWSDGSLHVIPETFQLSTTITPLMLWQRYCCRDESNGYPPLRKLKLTDFSAGQKRRFGDVCWLMGRMEKKLCTTKQWIESPTLHQANDMFHQAEDEIALPRQTKRGRVRRDKQMKWTSQTTLLRMYLNEHSDSAT